MDITRILHFCYRSPPDPVQWLFSDRLTADSSDKPIRRLPVTKVNADSEDMHIPARLDLQFFPEFIAGHGNIAGRHFRLRIFRAESPYRLFVKRNDICNIEHLAEELHVRIPFRSIRREIQMRGTGSLDQAGAQRRTHGIEKACLGQCLAWLEQH